MVSPSLASAFGHTRPSHLAVQHPHTPRSRVRMEVRRRLATTRRPRRVSSQSVTKQSTGPQPPGSGLALVTALFERTRCGYSCAPRRDGLVTNVTPSRRFARWRVPPPRGRLRGAMPTPGFDCGYARSISRCVQTQRPPTAARSTDHPRPPSIELPPSQRQFTVGQRLAPALGGGQGVLGVLDKIALQRWAQSMSSMVRNSVPRSSAPRAAATGRRAWTGRGRVCGP